MQKNFTKESKEREMFGAFWDMCQKYWIPENNDDYWNAVVKASDEFNDKYKDLHPMVFQLTMAFVKGLEDKLYNDR